MGKQKKRLTYQGLANKIKDMPVDNVGYAGLTQFREHSPVEARERIRQTLLNDPDTLALMKDLFEKNPEQKEAAYKDWATKGLLPPFDGLV